MEKPFVLSDSSSEEHSEDTETKFECESPDSVQSKGKPEEHFANIPFAKWTGLNAEHSDLSGSESSVQEVKTLGHIDSDSSKKVESGKQHPRSVRSKTVSHRKR